MSYMYCALADCDNKTDKLYFCICSECFDKACGVARGDE